MKVSYRVNWMHPQQIHSSSDAMSNHYNCIMSIATRILVFKRLTCLCINFIHKSVVFGGMTLPFVNVDFPERGTQKSCSHFYSVTLVIFKLLLVFTKVENQILIQLICMRFADDMLKP